MTLPHLLLAAPAAHSTLTGLDWVMIALYFSVLAGVAWWVVSKSKNTATDYFLAGRNLSWWIIGASIFASNIGSEHVVGLAGSGAADGVAMAHYELHAWCLLRARPGCSCPSTCARRSSRCRSSWSGASRPPRATCCRSSR